MEDVMTERYLSPDIQLQHNIRENRALGPVIPEDYFLKGLQRDYTAALQSQNVSEDEADKAFKTNLNGYYTDPPDRRAVIIDRIANATVACEDALGVVGSVRQMNEIPIDIYAASKDKVTQMLSEHNEHMENKDANAKKLKNIAKIEQDEATQAMLAQLQDEAIRNEVIAIARLNCINVCLANGLTYEASKQATTKVFSSIPNDTVLATTIIDIGTEARKHAILQEARRAATEEDPTLRQQRATLAKMNNNAFTGAHTVK